MKSLNKKGQIDRLGMLISGLGTLAILMAIIFLIIASSIDQVEEQDPCWNSTYAYNSTSGFCCVTSGNCTPQATYGSYATSYTLNATRSNQSAASEIPGWLPIIVITVIGGILLFLVRMFRNQ